MENLLGQSTLMAMILDRTGFIYYLNARLQEVLSESSNRIVKGCHWHNDFVPAARRALETTCYQRMMETGEQIPASETVIHGTSGNELRISWNTVLVHGSDSAIIGCAYIGTDISVRREMERQIVESKNHYQTLVENLPQKIFLKDSSLKYLSCNSSYASDLGISSTDIRGYTDMDFFPPEIAKKQSEDDMRILNTGLPLEIEERHISEGKERWNHIIKTPVRHLNRSGTGILGIIWDVTEQKEAELSARRSEQLLKSAFSYAPIGIGIMDTALHFSEANAYLCQMLDSNETALVGAHLRDILLAEDIPLLKHAESKLLKGNNNSIQFEVRPVRNDGKLFWCSITLNRVIDPIDNTGFIIGVYEDISARKDVEARMSRKQATLEQTIHDRSSELTRANRHLQEAIQQRQQSELKQAKLLSKYEMLMHALGDVIYEHNVEQNTLIWSASFEAMLHYSEAEMGNSPDDWKRKIHPDDLHTYEMALGTAYIDLNPYEVEYRVKQKSGHYIWVQDRGNPQLNTSGHIQSFIGILKDTTDRKKSESDLRLTRSAMDHANESILWIERSGRILYANRKACFFLQYKAEDLSKILIWDIEKELTPMDFQKRWQHIRNEGTLLLESTFTRRDNHCIPVEISYNRVDFEGNEILYAFAHDISERKRFENELRKSEERFRSLFESTSDAIFVWNTQHVVLYANQAALNLIEKSRDKVIGKHIYDSLTQSANMGDIWKQRVDKVFTQRKQLRVDDTFLVNQQIIHSESVISPILDSNGETFAVAAIYRDTTLRRQAEKRLEKYAQTQAVLLREVNHRVKNNLAAIISMLHKAEERAIQHQHADPLPLLKDLEGRVYGLAMVHSLLSAHNWEPLPLSELSEKVIEGSLKGLPLDKKAHVEIQMDPLLVNSNQAHHITLLINELATNSIKHGLKNRDTVRIEMFTEFSENQLILTYRDDGPGYPQTLLDGNWMNVNVGMELIKGISEQSLAGTLELSNENGAITRIHIDRDVLISETG
jgi:PAS domain S-box-containing protein